MGYQPRKQSIRNKHYVRLLFTENELKLICDAIMIEQLNESYKKKNNVIANGIIFKCNNALNVLAGRKSVGVTEEMN